MKKAEETMDKEKTSVCPHCGYDVNAEPSKVSEDDKKEYYRRLLDGNRFTKEYSYMDGNIVFMFRELTSKETDLLVRHVTYKGTDAVSMIEAMRSKFILCCENMTIGAETVIEKPFNVSKVEDVARTSDIFSETVGKKSTVVMHLADDAIRRFSELLDGILQKEVLSVSF